jgi:phospholipid transport system substrate-binding protein
MTQLQAIDRDIHQDAYETCVRQRNRNFAMLQHPIGHRSWGIPRIVLCTATFVFAFSHLAIASDLTVPIEQLDAGLLQVMKAGKSAPFKQRYDVLAPLVTRAVDLDTILEGGVGPGWASLPSAEQAALKAAFQRYSIATYVSHFDDFAGERFDLYAPAAGGNPVVPVKRFDLYAPAAGGNPVVPVKIVPGKLGDDTHVLRYAMRQTPDGWKAIDVTADSSISQVVAQQEKTAR